MRLIKTCQLLLLIVMSMTSMTTHAESVRSQRNFMTSKNIDEMSARERLFKKEKDRYETPLPLPQAKIVIDKSERKLYLYNGEKIIKTYPVGLGRRPNGQKQKQGDFKTPEGTYYISQRNPASKFHMFLGLNYPASTNAIDAYNKRAINKPLRDKIIYSELSRETPPWNTTLGGAVGIHGFGERNGEKRRDWTWGCIALSDQAIEELWLATNHWTPVEIKK